MSSSDANGMAAARASALKKRKRNKARANGTTKRASRPRRTTIRNEIISNETLPSETPQVETTLESVSVLEEKLQTDVLRESNCLFKLVKYIQPGGEDCVQATNVIRRSLGEFMKHVGKNVKLKEWVASFRVEYYNSLVNIVKSEESSDSEVELALAVCSLGGEKVWKSVTVAALKSKNDFACDTLARCFVVRFANLRTYSLLAISDTKKPDGSRALILLDACKDFPLYARVQDAANEEEEGTVEETARLKSAYGKAWLRVLSFLEPKILTSVLRRLRMEVLPRVDDPLSFAEVLTDCYNNVDRPDVCVASLDSLFYLISKHRFDYPLFYPKLYALLTPAVLWESNRADEKFLELTSKLLTFGEGLPGGFAAAFVKRLTRRALHAPPAVTLWCLRLALDILHRHPNVSYLVHRSLSLFDAPTQFSLTRGEDPYDDECLDPQESGASASSLWELECLRNHISPAVTRLVSSFSRDVRKKPLPPPGSAMDYASLTFADVFEGEFRRRAKVTPIAYDAPGCAPGVLEFRQDLGDALQWR